MTSSRYQIRAQLLLSAFVMIVFLFGAVGVARAQNYPANPPSTPQPAVSPATEVKGVKIVKRETLPVTGSDIVGLTILAGALISIGTVFTHRRPKAEVAASADTPITKRD